MRKNLNRILTEIDRNSNISDNLRFLDNETKKEVIKTLVNYDFDVMPEIANWLQFISVYNDDKTAIINANKIFRSNEIVNTINMYKGGIAEEVTSIIGYIVYKIGEKDTILETARTIKKYSGYHAVDVGMWLREMALYTGDKNKVARSAKVIKRIGRSAEIMFRADEMVKALDMGLDRYIKDRNSLYAVYLYVRKDNEFNFPKPTEKRLKKYSDIANSIINKRYKIDRVLELDQISMLVSIDKESKRDDIFRMINNTEYKNKREYLLEDITSDQQINLQEEDIKRYAVISVLGSKNKSTYDEAYSKISPIVGEKMINRAKNSLYTNHRDALNTLKRIAKSMDYDKAVSVLEGIKDEYIPNVISIIHKRKNGIKSNNIMYAVESKNPLDYNSNVQMACVYLPGANYRGISEYIKDPNVVLVKYDIGKNTLGSAICYKDKDKFLVDSVEGSRGFRKKRIFEKVYQDLLFRAKEYGCNEMIIGNYAFNITPREFIKYISSKYNLELEKTKLKLETNAYFETDSKGLNYIVKI